MIDFLLSCATAFGIVAAALLIGMPLGYWYLTHILFPLLNLPYETHNDRRAALRAGA